MVVVVEIGERERERESSVKGVGFWRVLQKGLVL